MKKSSMFVAHVSRYKPVYLWFPLAIVGVILAIHSVNWLTGRSQFNPNEPGDSPEVLIGIAYRVFQIVLALIATWAVKTTEALNKRIPLSETATSYAASRFQTVALICVFLYFLTH